MPNDNLTTDKPLTKEQSDATAKKISKKERRKLKVEEKESTAPKHDKQTSPLKPNNTERDNTVSRQDKNVKKSEKIQAQTHESSIEGGKTKAQLRAERRELQEKQRLQKLAATETKQTPEPSDVEKPSVNTKVKPAGSRTKAKSPSKTSPRRGTVPHAATKTNSQRVQLFSHLEKRVGYKPLAVYQNVHPSFTQLGAQYAAKSIIGSDARCLALLSALKQLINDFTTPFNQELCRAFETHLNNNVEHLQHCRPFAVSMTNALRHFKLHLTHITSTLADFEKKEKMQTVIDSYVEDEIDKAADAIIGKVCEKITDNDVILTYGHSSLVNKILIHAKLSGKHFKVIIVDARPLLEGRQTLNKLVQAGIECTYILISAASFIMNRATKVIVGAHALLNNGYVMARTGTALVALIAKTHMKPVLVCCETSKFSERAQTDSFVYNEIGDPNDVMEIKTTNGYLNALNLMYDVTPPKYVTGVATELGILPCTSVPVILRLKPTE